MDKLLEVENLKVRFYTYEGIVKAIEGINLEIRKGETLGLVGETGCGKSVTGLSMLVLVPPPGRIEDGKVILDLKGRKVNLLKQKEPFLLKIRGKEISMIFQEPNAALNPVYTVKEQIGEAIFHHRRREILNKVLKSIEEKARRKGKSLMLKIERWFYEKMLANPEALSIRIAFKIPILRRFLRRKLDEVIRNEVIAILREMEIPDPERVADMYPHELSGGMQQRVVIAMALACNPSLLIADEPTTSLDVTVQAQILDLIRRLKRKFGSSVVYITHDMGVIAEMCDRVAVMYAGYICELAEVKELFKNPLHPYTKALLESIPRPDKEFKSIRGTVPNLINPPSGCRFHPRCDYAMDICRKVPPRLVEVKKGHFVACHLYPEGGMGSESSA
ncbi:ABC transporter ATP-binding protein [Candidatus Geothermarchaeota archaeon]|nr:MAG: ABC transporter ATP-binding protein [Candidatus Geothermarchaeota archaeon]